MRECSKPGCRYPATEDLDGKGFCFNCWEITKDKLDSTKPIECTESGCRYPATNDFKGKKLCQDCWEKYKEKEARSEMDLRNQD